MAVSRLAASSQLSLQQHPAPHIPRIDRPGQSQRGPHVLLVQPEQLRQRGLAAAGQRHYPGPPDQRGFRAQRERLDQILPAADAAIDQQRGLAADRVGDLWQYARAGGCAAQLPHNGSVSAEHDPIADIPGPSGVDLRNSRRARFRV